MFVLAVFAFPMILLTLLWSALGVLNLWIWNKGKAQGNLLMMIGAFVSAAAYLIVALSDAPGEFLWLWLPVIALGVFVAGFYMTVSKLIEAQMAGVKAKLEKLKEATAEKDGDDA